MLLAALALFALLLGGSLTRGAAGLARPFTSPEPAAPEFGHGLTYGEPHQGWITLFDGRTTFGWSGGRVERSGGMSALGGGATTTSEFADYEVRVDTPGGGELLVGAHQQVLRLPAGPSKQKVEGLGRGPLRLGKGLAVRTLLIRPLKLVPVFAPDQPGATDRPFKLVPHPSVPAARQAKWEALPDHGRGGRTVSGLAAVGGPGAAELPGEYGDFVLQLVVRVRRPLSNAGVFFRCMPGRFLDGYEAQIFNGCYDKDAARPAEYATGAIDDRQNARRLVSRDAEPFALTIVAVGPHIATWVNGAQVTDFTDAREPNENPRKGLRLKPGPIQLQAHDRNTDVEFHSVRIGVLDRP
jgi:hypothetical protein